MKSNPWQAVVLARAIFTLQRLFFNEIPITRYTAQKPEDKNP